MAMLHFLFPQLRLFLCLALCFSPALSESYNDICMVLDAASTSDNLGISTKASKTSGGNTEYTVSIPVNNSISAVILKAVNQNNSSVGSWDSVPQKCNDSSVLYYMTFSNSSIFQATWIAPNSEDMTEVKLQVFLVIDNRTATMSSVRLEEKLTTEPSTNIPEISKTSQSITMATAMTTAMARDRTTAMASGNTTAKTTAMASDNTTAKTTAMASDNTTAKTTAMSSDNTTAKTTAMTSDNTTAKTTSMTTAKTTAKSLAINALGSPLIGALHILLVFLISKLLF